MNQKTARLLRKVCAKDRKLKGLKKFWNSMPWKARSTVRESMKSLLTPDTPQQ